MSHRQFLRNLFSSHLLLTAILCASFVTFIQEQARGQSTDAELPRVYLDTTYPATSKCVVKSARELPLLCACLLR